MFATGANDHQVAASTKDLFGELAPLVDEFLQRVASRHMNQFCIDGPKSTRGADMPHTAYFTIVA